MSFATVAVADDKDYEFQQQSKDMGRTTLSIDVLTTMQIFLSTYSCAKIHQCRIDEIGMT